MSGIHYFQVICCYLLIFIYYFHLFTCLDKMRIFYSCLPDIHMSNFLTLEASAMSMSKSLFRIYFSRKLGHTYVQGFHFIFCNNTSEHRKYAYLPVSGAPRSRTLLSAPEEPHLAPLLLVADSDTVNSMNLNRENLET